MFASDYQTNTKWNCFSLWLFSTNIKYSLLITDIIITETDDEFL